MSRRIMRTVLGAAAALTMTTVVGFPAMAEGKTITFMCWYDEDDVAGVIDALNEELGGEYEVEYSYVAQSDFNNVLSTQLAAGEGPDIVADGTNFPARIKAGNIMEITGEDFLEDFNEAGFALCSDGDQIYGIPSYGWFSGIWYNKDIFEANGVEVPVTFDEFVAVCDTFAQAGVQPMSFGLADGDSALHSVLGYLENSFYHNNDANPDGTDFDVKFAYGETNMNGSLNDVVTKWSTLIDKGYINADMLGISNDQAVADFIAGNAAMLNGGPWQYTNFEDAGMNFGMMSHLSESGENKYMVGGPAVNFGINANTKDPEGAMKVLKAFGSVAVLHRTESGTEIIAAVPCTEEASVIMNRAAEAGLGLDARSGWGRDSRQLYVRICYENISWRILRKVSGSFPEFPVSAGQRYDSGREHNRICNICLTK